MQNKFYENLCKANNYNKSYEKNGIAVMRIERINLNSGSVAVSNVRVNKVGETELDFLIQMIELGVWYVVNIEELKTCFM